MKSIIKVNSEAELNALRKLCDASKEPYKLLVRINNEFRLLSGIGKGMPIIISNDDRLTSIISKYELLGEYDYANNMCFTKEELQCITVLNGAFNGRIENKKLVPSDSKIEDLSVFKYFNVTDITGYNSSTTIYGGFFAMTELKKIETPNSLTEIGNSAFAFCLNLESIKLSSKTKVIKTKAFFNCINLKDITIPASVTTIERGAFSKCASLKKIVVNATTPPSITSTVFADIAEDFKICVPAKSVELYKVSWKDFAEHIVAK